MQPSTLFKRERLVPIAIALIAVPMALALGLLHYFQMSERRVYSREMANTVASGRYVKSSNVVHIPIDDNALLANGRWPWGRDRFASILRALRELGLSKVFLDIEFPEPSDLVVPRQSPLVQSLDRQLAALGTVVKSAPGSVGTTAPRADVEAWREGIAAEVAPLVETFNRVALDPDRELEKAIERAVVHAMPVFGLFYVEDNKPADEKGDPQRWREWFEKRRQDPAIEPVVDPARKWDAIAAALLKSPHAVSGWSPEDVSEIRSKFYQVAFDAACSQEAAYAPQALIERRLKALWPALNLDLARNSIDRFLPVAMARTRLLARFGFELEGKELLKSRNYLDFGPPLPGLVARYSGLSISTMVTDDDGTTRRMRLLWQVRDRWIPGTSFLLFLSQLGLDPARPELLARNIRVMPGPVLFVRSPGGEYRIPIDPAGAMPFRLTGTGNHALPMISISLILEYIDLSKRVESDVDGHSGYRYGRLAACHEKLEHLASLTPVERDQLERECESLFPDKGKLTPRDWIQTIETAQQDMKRSRRALVETSIAKFRKKPAAVQQRELADPEGRWTGVVAEADRLERLRALTETLSPLKGAIGVIGADFTGNTDVTPTALEGRTPGYRLHAHGLSTLLSRVYLHPPAAPWDLLVPALVLPLLSAIGLNLLGLWGWLVSIVLIIYAYWELVNHLFTVHGLMLNFCTPVLSLVLASAMLFIYRHLSEFQTKQRYRKMFEAYLDSRVIEQYLENPRLFAELGGTACEITAFFSDIEGFTTISELLPAEQLATMLNHYLSPMTRIILENGGLRDKYIGDAIVAMFGAPLHTADHATQACLSALAQQEALAELINRPDLLADPESWLSRLKASGKTLRIRIGLNSGIAKVGNFGSDQSYNYTMIGDAVNLASRLESAAKQYKIYTLIGDTTYRAARSVVEVREIDRIVVKGKLEPVTVYELLSRKGQLDETRSRLCEAYESARTLYLARDFAGAKTAFEKALTIVPNDGPSLIYAERCQTLITSPPQGDWDGSFTLHEK